jgi:hypothetical protein
MSEQHKPLLWRNKGVLTGKVRSIVSATLSRLQDELIPYRMRCTSLCWARPVAASLQHRRQVNYAAIYLLFPRNRTHQRQLLAEYRSNSTAPLETRVEERASSSLYGQYLNISKQGERSFPLWNMQRAESKDVYNACKTSWQNVFFCAQRPFEGLMKTDMSIN